jgi:hypothetical protein
LLSLALGIQMSRASLNALALVCKLNTRWKNRGLSAHAVGL